MMLVAHLYMQNEKLDWRLWAIYTSHLSIIGLFKCFEKKKDFEYDGIKRNGFNLIMKPRK
jgi:hypothetical protein